MSNEEKKARPLNVGDRLVNLRYPGAQIQWSADRWEGARQMADHGYTHADGSPILVEEPEKLFVTGAASPATVAGAIEAQKTAYAAAREKYFAQAMRQNEARGEAMREAQAAPHLSGVTQADVQRWMANAREAMGITRLSPTEPTDSGKLVTEPLALETYRRRGLEVNDLRLRLEAAEHRASTIADEAGDLRHELSRVHEELGRVTMALDAARRGKR